VKLFVAYSNIDILVVFFFVRIETPTETEKTKQKKNYNYNLPSCQTFFFLFQTNNILHVARKNNYIIRE